MISDTLCEAAEEIRRYQREMPDIYGADKDMLDHLVACMDYVRSICDIPPFSDRSCKRESKDCERLSHCIRRRASRRRHNPSGP